MINKGKRRVFVRVIPRETATKISEVTNRGTFPIRQQKISRNIYDTFMILTSARTGRLNTGLTHYVENPFRKVGNKKPDMALPTGFPTSLTKEPLVKYQYVIEARHGVPFDHYTDEPVRNPKDPTRTFMQEFTYRLNDGTTILDLDNNSDEIAYNAMKASKFFANSKKELDENKWQYAKFYISSESEDEEDKFKKKQRVNKAIAALSDGGIASDSETQRKITKILLPTISKSVASPEAVYNLLDDSIDRNNMSPTGKDFITRFLSLIDLLNDPKRKQEFEAMYFLQILKDHFIVSERQGDYIWNRKGFSIGNSYEQAVDFLVSPDKQMYHEELEKELKTAIEVRA